MKLQDEIMIVRGSLMILLAMVTRMIRASSCSGLGGMVRLPPKYYLCVTQENSQMAWASPVWLEA